MAEDKVSSAVALSLSHSPHEAVAEKRLEAVPNADEPEPSLDNSDEPSAPPIVKDDSPMYNRFSPQRKAMFVVILALCGILSPISSTGSLTAVPQIAATFQTSGSIVNISNGLYTAAMGLSSLLCGSISTLCGRQVVLFTSVISFFVFSLGTALAPNLAAFFAFRMLSGFGGTGLLVIGSGCIGDMYKPTERGTALGWYMSGTLIGPALGPLLGGVIVTYTDWRAIYWLQSAMSGLASLLAVSFIPETIHHKRWSSIPREKRLRALLDAINPLRLLILFRSQKLVCVSMASSALVFNMYSILAPIVYVINPRLNLTTPLESGLFYLAPGCGYLAGTFFGGRWSDRVVKKWIRKRNGHRKPEDRLRSAVPWLGLGIPGSLLVYGWCLEYNRGGIPVIVISMFVQGFCQLMVFPSLNTYCLDVIPSRSAEVLAGNYLIRYIFGAIGTAVVLPAVDSIGIGAFSTITAGFVTVTCGWVILVIHDGALPWSSKRGGD
ncbi:MFS transporter- DHA1 family- multidrug resistance protein [Apiospora arundinis]|uniref:MFS general substrate transporter n=1 Tax=Apiospora arundinis TaxID=335852 RepID=A0ABR2I3X4_9PEZI